MNILLKRVVPYCRKESVLERTTFSQPIDLGHGLLLRQATWQDAEKLAAFNIRIHSDDPQDPEVWLGEWTKDLLRGDHPTTGPQDFTVVVDQEADEKMVSSVVLIPQTWRYEEIPFTVGRPELVGTDKDYRRRGLVRRQMNLAHARSQARGHLAQVITGIPYYYRRFGYEMALDLGGSRMFPYDRLRKLKSRADDNDLQVREATVADLTALQSLYARHCGASMVSRARDEKQWHYEMHDAHESSAYRRRFRLVETAAGEPRGYFEFTSWPGNLAVREIAAAPGASLRQVALQVVRYLKRVGTENEKADQETPTLLFALGVQHPAYRALVRELVPNREPYAWYLRVPNLPAFLTKIAPVLERRLAGSVVAGYTGALRLNCTEDHVQLNWKAGTLHSLERFEPKTFDDGNAFFPGLTFLQLLFGFRDLNQLHDAHPDAFGGDEETYVVLSALFPRKVSQPVGLG